MGVKALLFAAMLVTALILGALTVVLFGVRTMPRYSEVGGNDGATVWRIDNRTGEVSVCGTALSGVALAQAESQLASRIRSAGFNRAALAALSPEQEELDNLSRPRCSPWSLP
jgi:hypothetical protein